MSEFVFFLIVVNSTDKVGEIGTRHGGGRWFVELQLGGFILEQSVSVNAVPELIVGRLLQSNFLAKPRPVLHISG